MTSDRPAPGLVIWQPARGFRYGAEAFWVAGFALEGGAAATALDLGTGSGIVALLLARQGLAVTGFDVRPEWAPLWARTLAASSVSADLRVGDLRDARGPVDLVVSNPPYFLARTGPTSPDEWKSAARTESTATLADFVDVAVEALAPGGRACFVIPREREPELLARGIHRRWVRVGSRRSLVELVPGASAAEVPDAVAEDDPRPRAWYAAVTGIG